MSFANPVTAGKDIARAIVQSPNFSIAAKTGWAIYRNGDAFFFNITAEGAVSANTVIVSGSGDGVFVYDGTPGPGTLIVAIASQAGTDPYGNHYSGPGIAISVPGAAGNEIQVRPDKGAIFIYSDT